MEKGGLFPSLRPGLAPFSGGNLSKGEWNVKVHTRWSRFRARTNREWRRIRRGGGGPLLLAGVLGACCALVILVVLALARQQAAPVPAQAAAVEPGPAVTATPSPEPLGGVSEKEEKEAEPTPEAATPTPAPTEDPDPQEQAAEVLNRLRDVFPEGKYWNHMGVEDWDEYTVTDTPCQHDVYGDTYCNGYYDSSVKDLWPQFDPLEQCLGFAALLSDMVFGKESPVTTFEDYTLLRVGDHVRLNLSEHSMVVLSVEEKGITVVECDSDYEHCRISWDRFISWDDLSAYAYEILCITRYAEPPEGGDF